MILNILKWIGTIASVVSLVVGIIIAIKNGHFKKLLGLYHVTKQKVAEAEKIFGQGNGDKKFAFVFAQLIAYCATNKIKYTDAEIENKINDEVKFMNTHKELENEAFQSDNKIEFISENIASDSTHNQTILGRM
ncbi:MAG: hypothetical protein II238_01285 [Alphaproteobacteria bacterium]|nr:hypothetical protein [Alphaproteobacteria bacterium]